MALQRSWVLARVVYVCAALLALASCDQDKRRYYAACESNEDCESNVCYNGHCTASCTSNKGCGTGICVEDHCLPTGAACEDGDPCTVGDIVGISTCKAGGPKDCGAGNFCQDMYCLAGHGCDAKAKNVGKTCDNSPVRVCADGSLLSGGCKCAAWQGNPIGPYDEVSVGGGTTTSVAKGVVQIRGIAPLAGKAVLVGVAKAAASDPQWTAWLAVVNSAAQNLQTELLPAANSQWNSVDAEGVVAVGEITGIAAVLPLAEPLAKASLVGAQVLQPMAQASTLRAVASDSKSIVAVGSIGTAVGMLVRLDRTGTNVVAASMASSNVQHPQASSCALYGVAASNGGFVVAGSCGQPGSSLPWVAQVAGTGATPSITNSQLLQLSQVQAGSLTGLAANPSGGLLAWGSAKTASSTQTGLAVGLDSTGKVLWSQVIGPGSGQPTDLAWFTGGAAWHDGTWLLVGGRSGSTLAPWALRTDGAALHNQTFGSSANALGTAVRGDGAVYIGGSQGDRPWLQRFGPTGQTDCK